MDTMSEDPKWPRAASLISDAESQIGIIDIPASKTSISPTSAHLTPAAIRSALSRFSTYSYTTARDLGEVSMQDLGATTDPDSNDNIEIDTDSKEVRAGKSGFTALSIADRDIV